MAGGFILIDRIYSPCHLNRRLCFHRIYRPDRVLRYMYLPYLAMLQIILKRISGIPLYLSHPFMPIYFIQQGKQTRYSLSLILGWPFKLILIPTNPASFPFIVFSQAQQKYGFGLIIRKYIFDEPTGGPIFSSMFFLRNFFFEGTDSKAFKTSSGLRG